MQITNLPFLSYKEKLSVVITELNIHNRTTQVPKMFRVVIETMLSSPFVDRVAQPQKNIYKEPN